MLSIAQHGGGARPVWGGHANGLDVDIENLGGSSWEDQKAEIDQKFIAQCGESDMVTVIMVKHPEVLTWIKDNSPVAYRKLVEGGDKHDNHMHVRLKKPL